jgi:nucleoside-diphosphate-sugar epimerase
VSAPAILLTGAGVVGRELLVALLNETDKRIAIIMRHRGRRTAAQRAVTMFDELGLPSESRARIDVIRGDVTAAGLGLDGVTQGRLADSLEVILHTAATTSLAAERALCDAVNRAGTANALILAERCYSSGRLKRFVHFSTALVAGGRSAGRVREDELPVAPVHANHYEWSKYEAERIVRAAMHAGLPVTIFRPTIVVGDGDNARARDFTLVFPLMRILASGYVTRFPADPRSHVHLAPLDFVVDAVVRALDQPWTAGRTFHLTAPNPPTVEELFSCDAFFPPGARRPRLCPPAEFDPSACGARERELLDSVAFCFPYFNSRLSFDVENTRKLLPLPVTDAAFLQRLGRFAVESGYMHSQAAAG